MASTGTGVKGKSGTFQVHHSFYGDETDSKQDKSCFKCGQSGHWKRNCPQSSPKGQNQNLNTGGGRSSRSGSTGSKQQKDRLPPRNKKFHCALHKGTPGKGCYSWSCTALKYQPYEERIKLLRENGDCEHCAGDCPKNQCLSKVKRTCGGGKEGRGCGSDHMGHELFCQNAKICFSTQMETVLSVGSDVEDGVLLQIMKIPSIDSNQRKQRA